MLVGVQTKVKISKQTLFANLFANLSLQIVCTPVQTISKYQKSKPNLQSNSNVCKPQANLFANRNVNQKITYRY